MLGQLLAELEHDGQALEDLGFNGDEIAELILEVEDAGFPSLPDGDKEPFQTMSFTLHDTQAETVNRALEKAKSEGFFDDELNQNANGNALDLLASLFLNG